MSMISVPKSDIEFIFNLLGAKLSNSGGSSSTVKLNKSGKPKKQNSNKGKPTCHGDFVKMICEKFKDEVLAFKAENPEQKGAHLVFAANYKKEHTEEFASFEAEWKEAHPKDAVSDADTNNGSVAEGAEIASDADVKPKRTMSDEQKAKMKAGREASKAKKDAEKAGIAPAPVATPAPVVTAPVVTAPVVTAPVADTKKKPVKTAKKADAITTPVVAPIVATEPELLPFKMAGETYLRMGTKRPDGNHLWTSGHLWQSNKGKKGDHIGEIVDGVIDETASEPIA
jgi:hypothetical protein